MHFRIPIVAHATPAIPETVGGAGVLLTNKDPVLIAAAVAEVLSDREVQTRLEEASIARLGEPAPDKSWQRFETLLRSVLS